MLSGVSGVCQPQGFCSFPDSSCPSGQKFEPNAGDSLAGTCVMVDASMVCGGTSEACCATQPACVGGASCSSGMCQTCVQDVAFGRRFSCTLKANGTAWCAGANDLGQLGVGATSNTPNATLMQVRDSAAAISDVTASGAGRDHACAVRAGGAVWCWGANQSGQLGNNATFPMAPATIPPSPLAVQVVKTDGTPLMGIVAVTGGYDYTCGLDDAGGVWCWGQNGSGSLGDGTTTTRSTAAPVLQAAGGAALSGASNLVAGGGHTCVQVGGDAWCWGNNGNGQLANNTTTNSPVPIKVATTASLGAGMWDSCYVDADTSVKCVGWGDHGRLGNGQGASYEGTDTHVPVPVLQTVGGNPLMGASKVVAGAEGCALMSNTHVMCWGDDAYGQTGTGVGSTVPVEVIRHDGMPLTDVVSLYAHWTHVCARTSRGEVLCWGRGLEGEFGDGTFSNRGEATPMAVSCP